MRLWFKTNNDITVNWKIISFYLEPNIGFSKEISGALDAFFSGKCDLRVYQFNFISVCIHIPEHRLWVKLAIGMGKLPSIASTLYARMGDFKKLIIFYSSSSLLPWTFDILHMQVRYLYSPRDHLVHFLHSLKSSNLSLDRLRSYMKSTKNPGTLKEFQQMRHHTL